MSTKPGPNMKEPSPESVYQFVQEQDRPFVTSKEVAEEFGTVSRRTINERLNSLHEDGRLQKRKIGGNAVVWYVCD